MAAPVIFISSDVSVESVGSSFLRVILIGSISELLVALGVGAAVVASPARVLELDTHSSLEADPSEGSPPIVFVASIVSHFLCSDDLELDTEIPERHVSPIHHDAMLTRLRSRVALRSSSPNTYTLEIPIAPILPVPYAIVAPSSEFLVALVVSPHGICRRRAILIQHGKKIPIGRLYRTYPGRPCRALTMRKSVIPLPSHHLALRYTSHYLDHFTSVSSLSHSSSDHSSTRHFITGHSLSGHILLDTTDADSSTPSRFVHPSLTRTPRCTKAYLHWRSAPLSTRSPAATVTSFFHATRSLVPSRVDLLPARKRFSDFISLEDNIKEDIDEDVLEDIEADAMAIQVVVDMDVEAGVDTVIRMEVDVWVDVKDDIKDEVESSDRGTMEVGVDMVVGIDIPDGMHMNDTVKPLEQVKEALQDIYEHVMEIHL
uniref:Uncharacterized protein n=1 Tax=Tanacetum cinerariifolium TaxID=118510 RepID=A0A699J410_TANCI|nr:hypothetical protein [Tanacetum cinerariifolium]